MLYDNSLYNTCSLATYTKCHKKVCIKELCNTVCYRNKLFEATYESDIREKGRRKERGRRKRKGERGEEEKDKREERRG